jgi:hypothetical protein
MTFESETDNEPGENVMSNLAVFDFDGIHTADEVLNKLRSLQKEYLIDLEDACVVEREKGGKVHIKQAVNLTAMGAAAGGTRGAMWGALVGLLFMNPLAGNGNRCDYGSRCRRFVWFSDGLRHSRRLYKETWCDDSGRVFRTLCIV